MYFIADMSIQAAFITVTTSFTGYQAFFTGRFTGQLGMFYEDFTGYTDIFYGQIYWLHRHVSQADLMATQTCFMGKIYWLHRHVLPTDYTGYQ